MSGNALGTYLNDHLAGSVAAVELVDRAIEENAGTGLGAALAEIVASIREDQDVLRAVLGRLEVGENPIKKAGAWLVEKAGRLKVRDTLTAPLDRLEMLETLALGIQGKLALWRALQRVGDRHPALAGVDLVRMEIRAREQFERVEAYRIEAAMEAL